MAVLRQKTANLLEYFGYRSGAYHLTRPSIGYNPNDPEPYYLDQSDRADYPGPFDENEMPAVKGVRQRHLTPQHTEGLSTRRYRGNLSYVPVHIMLYGLGHHELFRRTGDNKHLDSFRRVADWLVEKQEDDGSWLTPILKERRGLTEPWRSAMTQGMAISCLVRAARLLDNDRYTEASVRALKPFHREVHDGGVTTYHDDGPFYEEYPCPSLRNVLNGFVFALWGLHDIERFTGNNEGKLLWNNGLTTLASWLPRYDMGYWSLYHLSPSCRNPTTPKYHELHVAQLKVMHAITGDAVFEEYHERWMSYSHTPFGSLRTLPAKLRWLMHRCP